MIRGIGRILLFLNFVAAVKGVLENQVLWLKQQYISLFCSAVTWNRSLQAYGSLILAMFSPFLHIEQYEVFSLWL